MDLFNAKNASAFDMIMMKTKKGFDFGLSSFGNDGDLVFGKTRIVNANVAPETLVMNQMLMGGSSFPLVMAGMLEFAEFTAEFTATEYNLDPTVRTTVDFLIQNYGQRKGFKMKKFRRICVISYKEVNKVVEETPIVDPIAEEVALESSAQCTLTEIKLPEATKVTPTFPLEEFKRELEKSFKESKELYSEITPIGLVSFIQNGLEMNLLAERVALNKLKRLTRFEEMPDEEKIKFVEKVAMDLWAKKRPLTRKIFNEFLEAYKDLLDENP